MLTRFLNTRIPSLIAVFAFIVCSLGFCSAVNGANVTGELSPEVWHALLLWGALCIVTMLAFCLLLIKATRHRREVATREAMEAVRRSTRNAW